MHTEKQLVPLGIGLQYYFFIQLTLMAFSKLNIFIIFIPPWKHCNMVVDLLILSGFPDQRKLYIIVLTSFKSQLILKLQ